MSSATGRVIMNYYSRMCLDAAWSQSDGTAVVQSPCNGSATQGGTPEHRDEEDGPAEDFDGDGEHAGGAEDVFHDELAPGQGDLRSSG